MRFDDFNVGGPRNHELPDGVRIYGPNATVAQDLEPEYIAIDGNTAWVTLQEANALAVIDIRNARVRRIVALGFKDHSQPGNELDASDRDNAINIANWPVFGMYQPDAIAAFEVKGRKYLITANEGDSRDYDAFGEESRVSALTLDPAAFPNAATLRANANLGRLTVTNTLGDTDGDGDFDQLYALGARSFTIWNAATGAKVFDSGAELEQTLANLLPDELQRQPRRDGHLRQPQRQQGSGARGRDGRRRARQAVCVHRARADRRRSWSTTSRIRPRRCSWTTSTTAASATTSGEPVPTCAEFDPADSDDIGDCIRPNPAAGDLGPEGLEFVPAALSPTRKPLLIVGNEVSGTTTVYEIR